MYHFSRSSNLSAVAPAIQGQRIGAVSCPELLPTPAWAAACSPFSPACVVTIDCYQIISEKCQLQWDRTKLIEQTGLGFARFLCYIFCSCLDPAQNTRSIKMKMNNQPIVNAYYISLLTASSDSAWLLLHGITTARLTVVTGHRFITDACSDLHTVPTCGWACLPSRPRWPATIYCRHANNN